MKESTKRIALWDNVKIFLIVAVIMGHSLGYFISEHMGCKGVYIFIYSFHMPAFIFVSGLFSKRTVNQNSIEKITPYILIYLFIKLISYFVNYINSGKYVSVNLLSESGMSWFCLSVFFMHLITMYTKKYRKGYILGISIVFSCLVGYCSGDADFLVGLRTVTFYPFFYLGYILEPDSIEQWLSDIKIRIIGGVVLVFALFIFVRYNARFDSVYDLFTGRHFYSDLPQYQILGGVFRLGTLMVSLAIIFMLISVMPRKRLIFSWVGQRTLPIYVFHGVCVFLIYNKLGMYRLPSLIPYGWQLMIIFISIAISLVCSNFVFNWLIKKIMGVEWKRVADIK